MSEVEATLRLFLPPRGRISSIAVGLLAMLLAAKTFADAYSGRWYPGRFGSDRPPIKAEWYHRLFMIFIGLGAAYVGWIMLWRSFTNS